MNTYIKWCLEPRLHSLDISRSIHCNVALDGRTWASGSREAGVKGTFSLSCPSLSLFPCFPCSQTRNAFGAFLPGKVQQLKRHPLSRALSAFLMWSSVLFPVSIVLWKVLGLNIAVYLSASQLLWDLVISVYLQLAQGLTVTGYGMKWDFPFPQ